MVRIKRFCSTFIFCLIIAATPSLLQAAPPYVQVLSKGAHETGSSTNASDPSLQGNAIVPSGGKEYVLGIGDRIRLTVYGETDLSGEYEVGSTGVVALPLIGDVPVANQSISTFEQAVRAKLTEGYLRDPRVSAQVINYRPFFILGEVSKPGSYPYVNGMTVINAIALAGGYTYRADKSGVTISHASDTEKKDVSAAEEAVVMPGDIIRVPERFF
jgi:protein involved in polysaccharide export with SLBB domain